MGIIFVMLVLTNGTFEVLNNSYYGHNCIDKPNSVYDCESVKFKVIL